MGSYANFDPREGSLTLDRTLTFNFKARQMIITNNSSTKQLQYKFNDTETYGTLNPTESISLYHQSRTVYLRSPSGQQVNYRVWGYG